MDEEIKVNYYSILPATVRYDKNLKANEKLLYSEITSLVNKYGYCYALNRYFAKIYNVTQHTVSQWISHLEDLNYIKIDIIRKDNKEVQERRIYINDTPYVQKNTYPHVLNDTYPIYKKVQYNNKILIDDLFNLVINNKDKIPKDFYFALEKLDLIYSKNLLANMQKENTQKIKEIIYTLYLIYESNSRKLFIKFERETLVNLYVTCKSHNTNDFFNYYKQSIINKYL